MKKDYYHILSLSSDAPDELIKTAYRTLCKKYHPDIYKGKDATLKTQEINEAYEILSTPAKRMAYDNTRGFSNTRNEETSSSTNTDINEQWNVITSNNPSLIEINYHLSKISRKLSTDFKNIVIKNNIQYGIEALAENLKNEFLQKHFGNDREIQEFALGYIYDNNTQAVKEINKIISSNYPDISYDELSSQIVYKYGLSEQAKSIFREQMRNEQYEHVKSELNSTSNSSQLSWFIWYIIIFALIRLFFS